MISESKWFYLTGQTDVCDEEMKTDNIDTNKYLNWEKKKEWKQDLVSWSLSNYAELSDEILANHSKCSKKFRHKKIS